MATQQVVIINGSPTTADTASTPNTFPLRDNAGGVSHKVVTSDVVYATTTKAKGVAKTTSFTADPTAGTVFWCNATGGAITATLPSAAAWTDTVLTFTKTDSGGNAVTVSGAVVAVSLAAQGNFRQVHSDGTNWQLIG
jgi:uncharacterized membrane protein